MPSVQEYEDRSLIARLKTVPRALHAVGSYDEIHKQYVDRAVLHARLGGHFKRLLDADSTELSRETLEALDALENRVAGLEATRA